MAGTIAITAMIGPPVVAQNQMPTLIKQINNGNGLPENEAGSLLDELFYQRAVYAYLTMLPTLNVIAMSTGSEAA